MPQTSRGAESTFEGRHFARKYMYEKLTKCPNFTWYLPENTGIYHDICRKNISPEIWGRGTWPPAPSPSSTSMTGLRAYRTHVRVNITQFSETDILQTSTAHPRRFWAINVWLTSAVGASEILLVLGGRQSCEKSLWRVILQRSPDISHVLSWHSVKCPIALARRDT